MIDSRDQIIKGVRDQLQRPMNRRAFAYWDKIRDGRAMPLRRDFEPFDIPKILPSMIMLQVMRPEIDFLFRIVGSRWVEQFGRDDTRNLMSKIEHQKPPSMIWDAHCHVVETGLPYSPSLPYVGPNAAYRDIECLIAPMSAEGEQVDFMFISIDFTE